MTWTERLWRHPDFTCVLRGIMTQHFFCCIMGMPWLSKKSFGYREQPIIDCIDSNFIATISFGCCGLHGQSCITCDFDYDFLKWGHASFLVFLKLFTTVILVCGWFGNLCQSPLKWNGKWMTNGEGLWLWHDVVSVYGSCHWSLRYVSSFIKAPIFWSSILQFALRVWTQCRHFGDILRPENLLITPHSGWQIMEHGSSPGRGRLVMQWWMFCAVSQVRNLADASVSNATLPEDSGTDQLPCASWWGARRNAREAEDGWQEVEPGWHLVRGSLGQPTWMMVKESMLSHFRMLDQVRLLISWLSMYLISHFSLIIMGLEYVQFNSS